MEIANYKGIIVVDNFISDEDNEVLVSLIDKPQCYETAYYWRLIKDGNLVTPLSFVKENGFYLKYTNLNNIKVNIVLENIHRNILRVIDSPRKLKVENSGIEKFSTALPYYADKHWTGVKEVAPFGTPTDQINDYTEFKPFEGEWLLSSVGTRVYASYIFINNDFNGGNFTFPLQEFEVAPVRNRLLCFPCDKNFIRGIRPLDGSEFLLSTWFEYS